MVFVLVVTHPFLMGNFWQQVVEAVQPVSAVPAAYSAPEVLMFITALGVLITGAGAVIVNIIVALKTTHKIDENIAKTDGLVNQVKEVHTLTNSNLAAVTAKLDAALAQVSSLTELVRELKSQRLETALHTSPPRAGTQERKGDVTQLDNIEALLDVKGEQIDNIETTVERVDKKVTPKSPK